MAYALENGDRRLVSWVMHNTYLTPYTLPLEAVALAVAEARMRVEHLRAPPPRRGRPPASRSAALAAAPAFGSPPPSPPSSPPSSPFLAPVPFCILPGEPLELEPVSSPVGVDRAWFTWVAPELQPMPNCLTCSALLPGYAPETDAEYGEYGAIRCLSCSRLNFRRLVSPPPCSQPTRVRLQFTLHHRLLRVAPYIHLDLRVMHVTSQPDA